MRQRNDSGYPVTVASEPPVLVHAGEEIDHPTLVAGFTNLEPPEPAEEPAGDDPADTVAAPPAKSGRRGKSEPAGEPEPQPEEVQL